MIKVITVEREYGSRGAEFARLLAEHLGWKLIDQCLIEEIAQKAGVTPTLAERCDERLDPWYHRFGKAFWHGSLERLPAPPTTDIFDSDRMVEFVKDYLTGLAEQGNCVIVGRGAAAMLARAPGVFHIFVYASMWRKIKWFEEQFPERSGQAEEEIIATDRRRAEYIARYFDRDWTDRRLYHLMMNSCMGFEAMIKTATDGAGIRLGEAALR